MRRRLAGLIILFSVLTMMGAGQVNLGEDLEIDYTKPKKFEILIDIWERLLPHRQLHISGDDIQVSVTSESEEEYYSGSEMSDGERAVFYMLGQTLVAAENSLIIF